MTSLSDILTAPERRPAAVGALAGVVSDEVAARSGLSGVALKAAHKAVTAISPDLVPRAIDRMLPDFATALDPFWQQRSGAAFGAYLSSRGTEVSDALLAVTDVRAANPDHARLARIYNGIRPKAAALVEAALPRLGTALESQAG